MTGPLHAILRASVEVWESDPVNFGFQQVGYVSIGESNQEEDYVRLQASQAASGYASDLYTGTGPMGSSPTCGPISRPRIATSYCMNTDPATRELTSPCGAWTRNVANGVSSVCME
jgi:hypothetical protein